MSNPLLTDSSFDRAAQAGWGAPDPATRSTTLPPLRSPSGHGVPGAGPVTDGPVSAWDPRVMTVSGTATATGVLLVILLAAAVAGWQATPDANSANPGFPGLAIVGVIVGLIAVVVAAFKPMLAKILGPVYAAAEGFFVGAISKSYNNWQDGIVLQALGATLAVFAVMLFLHKSRILKVTDRMRRVIVSATAGLMLFYLVSFVLHLVTGSGVSFLNSSSPMGIGFSVLAAGLAAFNLSLDFDFIEKGAARQLPKGMEWFAALGLLVTIVWLYLEMLRLLAKLQDRR